MAGRDARSPIDCDSACDSGIALVLLFSGASPQRRQRRQCHGGWWNRQRTRTVSSIWPHIRSCSTRACCGAFDASRHSLSAPNHPRICFFWKMSSMFQSAGLQISDSSSRGMSALDGCWFWDVSLRPGGSVLRALWRFASRPHLFSSCALVLLSWYTMENVRLQFGAELCKGGTQRRGAVCCIVKKIACFRLLAQGKTCAPSGGLMRHENPSCSPPRTCSGGTAGKHVHIPQSGQSWLESVICYSVSGCVSYPTWTAIRTYESSSPFWDQPRLNSVSRRMAFRQRCWGNRFLL